MKKIVIIGGSGFIGKNIVEYFRKKSFYTLAIIRKETRNEDKKILKLNCNEVINIDIYSLNELKKVLKNADIVLNIAGQRGGWDITEEMHYEGNVSLTKNIVNASKNKRLIHISTTGVYSEGINQNENFETNPKTIYGKYKLLGEKEIKKHDNYTIFRPTIVIGKYDLTYLKLIKAIKKRFFFLINNGNNKIEPIYAKDLAEILHKYCCLIANEKSKRKEIFNLSGKDKVTYKEFTNIISDILKIKRNNISLQKKTANSIAYIIEKTCKLINIKPQLTEDNIKYMSTNYIYDTTKINKIVKIKYTSLNKALEETIKWYKKEGYL